MTRFLALLLWPFAALCIVAAPARADVGNVAGIAPGLCDYPSICTSGAAFGEYDYAETWPTEINGSRRTCLLGGAMFQGTAGVSIAFVNASVTTPLGVIRGACWYACPTPMLEDAGWPNPPGSWKNEIHPPKCKPIGPAPVPITPPKPPDDDAPPNAPPGEAPTPPSGAPLTGLPPAAPPILPNQTNPGASNPFQPEGGH